VLTGLYSSASNAQALELRVFIHRRLGGLALGYRDAVDASVGTDDADCASAGPAPPNWTIQLTSPDGTRLFDVQHDLASLVCGRSAVTLSLRLQWPYIAIAVLGAAVPFLVIFAVHWANGGLGQFALAYEWPLWLELWYCVGWWLMVGVVLLWYASMQRKLAWMALKQFSTVWVIVTTGVFVAALISLSESGVHRSLWVDLPAYIGCALFFPLIAMADALPSKLRLRVLRFLGPPSFGAIGAIALVLRLPTAEDTPGELVWTVMGVNTVTNLQALTYSATVLTVLLAKGVLHSWVFPDRLAFIVNTLRIAEHRDVLPPARAASAPASSTHKPRRPCPPCDVPLQRTAKIRPLDVESMEDKPDSLDLPGILEALAQRLDAVGVDLATMHSSASGAEKQELGQLIRFHLHRLQLEYVHQRQNGKCSGAEASNSDPGIQAEEAPGASSHADASVGMDEVDTGNPSERMLCRRMTTAQVLTVLELGMTIELTAHHGARTVDMHQDMASLVCGRSAVALATRLRWPSIVVCALGGAVPVLVIFAVHWGTRGAGQFALAYEWPLWLELWYCVGPPWDGGCRWA
jgi:hypothetical protein